MIDVHRLKIFSKVAELKSFSKAAHTMYLTQPTVSQHMASLEDYFALPLFDRGGKEVNLTRAGELLYDYARKITMLTDEAQQTLDQFKGKKCGSVLVGASTIPGEYMLPVFLGSFTVKYPDIRTIITIKDSRDIVEMMLEGQLDLGIVGAKIKHETLHYTRLIDDNLVIVVPQGHPWCDLDKINIQALCNEPFVIRESGSGSRMALGKTLRDAGVNTADLNIVAEVSSNTAIKQAIKSGAGISLISELAVREEVEQGALKKVSIADVSFKRSFYIVQDKKRSQSPVSKTFVSYLKEMAKETMQ